MLAQEVVEAGQPLPWPMQAAGWVAVATLIGMGLRVLRQMVRRLEPLAQMARDWQGEPPRPGCEGRPGVPVRLAQIETRLVGVEGRLTAVEAELSPNGGRSVKDNVSALARQAGVDGESRGGT